MKKILAIFIFLVSGLSFWSVYEQQSREASWRIRQLEEPFTEVFIFPNYLEINDSSYFGFLATAADALGVNLFRTSWISDDSIQKFVYLTTETRFFEELTLTDGRVLMPEDTGYFLANTQTGHPNQIGRFTFFGNRQQVRIAPMEALFETLQMTGTYHAELPDSVSLETFILAFLGPLNARMHELHDHWESTDDFQVNDFLLPDIQMSSNRVLIEDLDYFVIFAFIITAILMVYYGASQTKKAGILKLNGMGTFQIWNRLLGRLINKTVCCFGTLLLAGAMSLSLFYRDFNFLRAVFGRQLLIYALLLFVSALAFGAISRIPIYQGVKNRSDKKLIFGLNGFFKLLLTASTLWIGTIALDSLVNIRQRQQEYGNWEIGRDYAIFNNYIEPDGWDRYEFLTNYYLYPVLNERGAVLAGPFSKGSGSHPNINNLDQNFLRVNPNYLLAFPLYDLNGNQITVSEEEIRRVVLAPAMLKPYEEEIIDFFEMATESFWWTDHEAGWFPDEAVLTAGVKIIWMENGQSAFTFDPHWHQETQNAIKDTVISVTTLANQTFMDLQITATPSINVRLVDQDPVLTYQELRPYLEAFGLENNILRFITIHEVMFQQLAELRAQAAILLLICGTMLTISLSIGIQNTIIFFKQHQESFVVKRLFGYGFFKTFQGYFRYFGLLWIPLLLSMFAGNHFLTLQMSVTLAAILLAGELLLSFIAIQNLENKNKLTVIKGDV